MKFQMRSHYLKYRWAKISFVALLIVQIALIIIDYHEITKVINTGSAILDNKCYVVKYYTTRMALIEMTLVFISIIIFYIGRNSRVTVNMALIFLVALILFSKALVFSVFC